jgi:hypothetical protein
MQSYKMERIGKSKIERIEKVQERGVFFLFEKITDFRVCVPCRVVGSCCELFSTYTALQYLYITNSEYPSHS